MWTSEVRSCESSRDTGNVDVYIKSSDFSILTSYSKKCFGQKRKIKCIGELPLSSKSSFCHLTCVLYGRVVWNLFQKYKPKAGPGGMKRKGMADCQNIESRRKLLGDRWSNLTSCLDSVILVLGVITVIADTDFTFLLLLLTQKGVAKNGFCKTSLQYYPKLTSPEPSKFKMVHRGSSLDSEPSWEGRQVFSLFLCFSLWGIQLMFSAIKK